MMELRLDFDGLDYEAILPLLAPLAIKNPAAAKVATLGFQLKTKGMSKAEKDAYVARLLSENKNKIISALNGVLAEKGISGYVANFDADLL